MSLRPLPFIELISGYLGKVDLRHNTDRHFDDTEKHGSSSFLHNLVPGAFNTEIKNPPFAVSI